ncbi:unnamed protein product [Urochloa humidicola]
MRSVRIPFEELKEATNAFDNDFSSGKMDDKIHRFPTGLRPVGDQYIIPMIVAIGPYHHNASDDLKKMEVVKRAAAFHLFTGEGAQHYEKVYENIRSVAGDARKLYAEDAVVGMEDAGFAAMMFLDACFLLQYMDVYPSFKSKDYTVNESLRRFLFINRACINKDIMLMENQLPWLVVEKIIESFPSHYKNYMNVVETFIADMGKTFKIREDADYSRARPPPLGPQQTPPPHLLGFLQRHKTEPGTQVDWPKLHRISPSSAIELAEIGIKLKASETERFTDMHFKTKGPFCGELSLAPLSLNDTRACWLVNMAAFEVSTASSFKDDPPNTTATCSYLALLSMFMLREEDVHELRSKRILHGHHTNAEILTFFKTIVKHLPDTGCRFANIMFFIEDYKEKRWLQTKFHKLLYNNFGAIIKMLTIVGTLVGIFQALLAFNHQKDDTPRQYFSFRRA